MLEIFIITFFIMMLTVRLFELVNPIFNSSSIHSHQRAVVQRQHSINGLSQAAMVSQAIAVIHSRIMEESPNSFPEHH
jgi:hypothetical protein